MRAGTAPLQGGPVLVAHHVTRPRLVRAVASSSRVLLVAAGGWGKTTLLTEWSREAGEPVAVVALFDEPTTLPALGSALARAVRRAGLSDLARLIAAETATAPDPRAAAEDVAHAFAGTPDVPAVVVDDVHRCDERAAAFLAGLVAHHPGRVVLAGRTLPCPPGPPPPRAPGSSLVETWSPKVDRRGRAPPASS